jgi:1-phosphofructokinase family hexose kinase
VILAAGLTPAWQQILVFDDFRYGEVNRAAEAHWCGSGKVLNAGIAAHLLGGPSLTLAPLGGPPLKEIDRQLAKIGVPRRWVRTRAATRVCTTLLERATGRMTELVENGRPLRPQEMAAFVQAYREEAARASVVILIGSLPFGAPVTLYRELAEATPCPMVLDFRADGLLSLLDLKPLVVKPNREELAQTVERPLADDADLHAAMRELNQRGAQWVVVTQGPGPVWISSANELLRFTPPPVAAIVNPIGCGDALAAGIAWQIRAGGSVPDAVALGMAAAAENLASLLPCRLDGPSVHRRAQAGAIAPVSWAAAPPV